MGDFYLLEIDRFTLGNGVFCADSRSGLVLDDSVVVEKRVLGEVWSPNDFPYFP